MVTAAWVALILLSAVLYGALVYLVSIGATVERMRDPATAPVWRLLLAGIKEGGKNRQDSEDPRREIYQRAA
jgi:hypothetical protein